MSDAAPGETELTRRLAYRIDADDRLCRVNRDWQDFARENGASRALAEGALGTLLWSHIEGDSIREIYRLLTNRARQGRPVSFTYRCDSPVERRTFLMSIRAGEEQCVDFQSDLIRLESRPAVRLLESNQPRGEGFVRVCAWCQRVAVSPEVWLEVEDAVNRLDLLQAENLPALTHGMCQACGARIMLILGR